MIPARIIGALALCGVALAAPPPPAPTITAAAVLPHHHHQQRDNHRRAPAGSLDPWVQVDDQYQATTLTPTWTTDTQGKSSLKDAAPESLTGSVFSTTILGEPTTTTGDPPNPQPTGNNGAGAFSRCFNKGQAFAPFCRPTYNSTLEPGKSYYVTWDPDFFKNTAANESYSLVVRLEHLNRTSNEWITLKQYDDQRAPAAAGYFALDVTDGLLDGHDENDVKLSLLQFRNSTLSRLGATEPYPLRLAKFRLPGQPATPAPRGHTLTIALPVVFGSIVVLVVGLCLWNRQTRRIQLGSIVSRRSGRGGYSGRGERRRRMFGGGAGPAAGERDIQLGSSGFPEDHVSEYRDTPARHDDLAASPVHEHFQQQGTTGGGRNAFRDEMDRQRDERAGGF